MYYRPSNEDDREDEALRKRRSHAESQLATLKTRPSSGFTLEEIEFILYPNGRTFAYHDWPDEVYARINEMYHKFC